ncbi:peptide ABC transporter substrate-binding protein [Rhodococcus sp. ACPA4]|uniref:ABC transporter substrate-binding protein n=1 Tax=Rhodococcus sp. ACPA4 TaxID=2028571 RepID=UPI000BB1565F|nr:ABC transporter substrate-binding protein [Rhodococcus sp. ACPA4]PBC37324.1 peptide ABC transporter substrate-binding protein [Rhodococcus sp. ACPA4]
MSGKWNGKGKIAAVSLVAALAVAGCGGGGGTSTAGGSTASAADIDRAAVLRVTASAPTRNLDPYLQTSYGGWGYLTPMFDRLTMVDKEGNLVPGLAESWEFSSDGGYLELKLRDDVSFHDGTKFDAAALAANVQRGKTMAGSTVVAALDDITSVDVVDPTTARLNLTKGSGVELPGLFSTNVGMMVSPKTIEAGTDIRNDPGQSGSGPYTVTNYVPEESLEVTRAQGDYWDPAAGLLGGISFKTMPDATTRLNGMQTAATDISWVSSANEIVQAQSLADRNVLGIDKVKFRNVLGVFMRARDDLAKPEVRQAVAHAIDPEAISALFSGTCTPYRQMYPESSWAADPSYQYPYTFDVDKAKSLVESAGGAKITLTFGAGTNTEKPANVIQSSLAAAGFEAELNPVPNTQNEPGYIAGTFQSMVSNSFSPKVDPAETVNTFVVGPYDFGNGNPEIAALATKAANPTLSQDERAGLYHEIWSKTLAEAMFVPICNQTNATIFSDKVVNADNIPWVDTGIFDLRYVGMTK